MSVSKVVRNPNGLVTGNAGYALTIRPDGTDQSLVIQDSGGVAMITFTTGDVSGPTTNFRMLDLVAQGNAAISGNLDVASNTFIHHTEIRGVNGVGTASLEVWADSNNDPPQVWRNFAGAVVAAVNFGGGASFLGDIDIPGLIWTDTIGQGLSLVGFDNNGVLQRVSNLTAGQSIRVNAAGTAFEAYVPASSSGTGISSGVVEPLGVVTPTATNQLYINKTGPSPSIWLSTGLTSADWQQLT